MIQRQLEMHDQTNETNLASFHERETSHQKKNASAWRQIKLTHRADLQILNQAELSGRLEGNGNFSIRVRSESESKLTSGTFGKAFITNDEKEIRQMDVD
jgi:hypothetical protein